MRKLNINPLSFTSIPISMWLDETQTKLADGTGFIYKYCNKYYLITNWHNVTGLNPINKKPIGKHGGCPDVILLSLLKQNKQIIQWKTFSVNLYENNNADWYIHPVHKENVDVVAIELEVTENFDGIFNPINSIPFHNFNLEIADDVFILGFPYTLSGGGRLPIWKKGSIATEPDVDYDKLPKILVDTASKSGMSGSPVIYKRVGIHGADNANLNSSVIFGEIQGFVGIYSGRVVGESNIDAQLGIVWKKEVIEEIIKGKIKDTFNFR